MAIAEREITMLAQAAEEDLTGENFVPPFYFWTREQFHQLGNAAFFEGQRVILMEGEILVMPPIGDLHAGIVTVASAVLRDVFGPGFFVREEKSFDVGNATDPQPDIAVVAGTMREFLYQGITNVALIVEVSDSTIAYDRSKKASLYAKAGVADYWVINLDQKPPQVEIHRQPQPDDTQHYGFGYGEKTVCPSGAIVQPLAAPNPVAVSALLP